MAMSAKSTGEERKETFRSDYEAKKQKRIEENTVLDPDSPLLEKFQKALKEHLLRQIEALKADIFEYEIGTKKKNAEREELGVQVYEDQQVVTKQQGTLENCIKQLETVTAAREENEHVLRERKEVHKKERQRLMEVEQQELELKNEVEATNHLIYQVSKWENTLESDINTKQRVFEKTRQEKRRLLEEKRLQDGLIYKLMVKTWQLEAELDKMEMQLQLKKEEREELAQTVALGNTNIEAIASEYRSLMHSWNTVIVALKHRDKVVACHSAELQKLEERFKSVLTEIEQVKKLCQKEMQKNEYSTLLKNRSLSDISTCKALINQEMTKRMNIERKINEIQTVMERTEEDITKMSNEMHFETKISIDLTRETERISGIKVGLEEDIWKKLENQTSQDKTALSQSCLIKEARRRNKELEITLAHCENKTSATLTQAEFQKTDNEINEECLEELETQVMALQKQGDDYDQELKKVENCASKYQREMMILYRKIEKITEKSGEEFEAGSPIEVKIITFEKDIDQLQSEINDLKQFWMREQTNLLIASQTRQEQIYNKNLMRKQTMIMEQKNLKITDVMDTQKKQCDKITRDVNQLRNKLRVLSEVVCAQRGKKDTMGKTNEVVQQEYANKLKDTELECLKLSSEMEQIEEDKIVLSHQLIELNREVLEWEKKFKLAKETKKNMAEERGQGGEVGNMQAEIHRMRVRYSQLTKAQDKLIEDLELCVNRRDAIVNMATAREKRGKDAAEKTRFNVARKLDDMRNKIKQMENETEAFRKRITNVETEHRSCEFDVQDLDREISQNLSISKEMHEELEDFKTERQMNFELLLQLQKRLALYSEVRKGRKPYAVYRTQKALTEEYKKHHEINEKMAKVIENLMSDFPNQHNELLRMLNTLKLPVYATHAMLEG